MYSIILVAFSHFSTKDTLSGIIQISCQDKMWSGFHFLIFKHVFWSWLKGDSLLVQAYLKLSLISLGSYSRWGDHKCTYMIPRSPSLDALEYEPLHRLNTTKGLGA